MGGMGALCNSPLNVMPWDKYHRLWDPRKNADGTGMWDSNGSAGYAAGEHAAARLQGSLLQIQQPARRPGTDRCGKDRALGNKVLALSYGGTLRLRGSKGTSGTPGVAGVDGKITGQIATLLANPDTLTAADVKVITDSGTDWIRLGDGQKYAGNGKQGSDKLTLDRSVANDWHEGDEIVVTTTDYFPDHSELRTIAKPVEGDLGNVIRLNEPLTYSTILFPTTLGRRWGPQRDPVPYGGREG